MADANSNAYRINIGAGDTPIEGYDNSFDSKQGKNAYPLDLPDASCDEVRASHILEHFGHRTTKIVLQDWVRVLKPGGLIRLAVPDFARIAQMYLEDKPAPYSGWVCGGQTDQLDCHLAILDWNALSNMMRECGLVGIHKWAGDQDCSGLPISLNIGGWKRPEKWPLVESAMSAPRLGFMDMFACATDALMPLGIRIHRRTGAFWGQCLTIAIESAMEAGAKYVLTLDYDTVFTMDTVEDLLAIAEAHPEVDALVPVQMHRMNNVLLMRPAGVPEGQGTWRMQLSDLDVSLYPIETGHFGCTLFRTEALRKLPPPWFLPVPDSEGKWGDGHRDDDIYFWHKWQTVGLTAFLAPRVVLGHLENHIMWPDRNLNKILQHPTEYWTKGRPANVWR